jgi:cell shape-determining protein MreC
MPAAFFITLGVVILLILINTFTFGFISRTLQTVTRPLWSTQARVADAFSVFLQFVHSKQTLIEENDRLRQEITTAKLLGISAQVIQQENEALRAAGLREDTPERIAGAVITRPNRSAYDTVSIDIGWQHGVKKDSLVFAEGVLLIGRVVEVYAKTALVQLYSSPGVMSDVLIGSEDTPAQAIGRGNGNFEVTLPRGITISEGDIVSSPALGGGLLGVVGEVNLNATDSFQTILFRSPLNIQSVRIVTVEL